MIKSEFNCKLILEEFADNPFLPLFYEDPERFAFTVELFFMTERYKQLQKELTQELFSDFTISDYTFVKTLLFAKQNLPDHEFRLFQQMYNVLEAVIPTPDILVYFHRDVPSLQNNIAKRGRKYETKIADNYLTDVQNSYFEYFRNILTFPVLIIDVNQLDFVKRKEDYAKLKDMLSREFRPGVHRINLM